jgi:hypothetical protein
MMEGATLGGAFLTWTGQRCSYFPCNRSMNGGKVSITLRTSNTKEMKVTRPSVTDFAPHWRDNTNHESSQTTIALDVTPKSGPVGV